MHSYKLQTNEQNIGIISKYFIIYSIHLPVWHCNALWWLSEIRQSRSATDKVCQETVNLSALFVCSVTLQQDLRPRHRMSLFSYVPQEVLLPCTSFTLEGGGTLGKVGFQSSSTLLSALEIWTLLMAFSSNFQKYSSLTVQILLHLQSKPNSYSFLNMTISVKKEDLC